MAWIKNEEALELFSGLGAAPDARQGFADPESDRTEPPLGEWLGSD